MREKEGVRRQDEVRLLALRLRAGAKGGEGLDRLAHGGDGDVYVVALEDTADVGFVGGAGAEALDRRLLVAEGREETERELVGTERGFGQCGDGFLDLHGVHVPDS